jgi:Flp pilus assembly protein TadG
MKDMMKDMRNDEQGQIVVIVAFALVVLLLAAGLAIDGGTLLFSRRSMQNAADAAALAGTRELSQAMCDNTPANATDAAVSAAVDEFSLRNGVSSTDAIEATYVRFDNFNDVVQFSPPVYVGQGVVPNGASGVAVTTTITQSTYFMGLVGTDSSHTGAAATAVTGPPFIVGGMRPFGVPLFTIQNMSVGECFTLSFKNCDEDAPLGDPDACYIYDDAGNEIGQHRGWMNLGYVWRAPDATAWSRAVDTSPDANDMKGYMCEGWNNTLWADCEWNSGCQTGDFIHALPGTTSSGIGALFHDCSEVFDQQITIPIYDLVPQYDEITTNKPADAGAGGYYYHVVGFGAVRIQEDGSSQGGGLLHACLDEVIMGQGQPSPNTGFGTDVCATHTMVVTLWR